MRWWFFSISSIRIFSEFSEMKLSRKFISFRILFSSMDSIMYNKPQSVMRHEEKLSFCSWTFWPARYRSPSMIRDSSSTIFLDKSTKRSLVFGRIAIKWAEPSGDMSLKPRERSLIEGCLSIPLSKSLSPLSPIPFPVRLRFIKLLELSIPAVMYSTPLSC